jgi:hypothetical protein
MREGLMGADAKATTSFQCGSVRPANVAPLTGCVSRQPTSGLMPISEAMPIVPVARSTSVASPPWWKLSTTELPIAMRKAALVASALPCLVAAGEKAHGRQRAIRDVVKCWMIGEAWLHEEVILQRLARQLVHQLARVSSWPKALR